MSASSLGSALLGYFWLFHLLNTALLLIVWRLVVVFQHTREDDRRQIQQQLDEQRERLDARDRH